MSKKTINFDQFISEKKSEYIDVTVYGKTYKVKNEIPAIIPIMLARAGEGAESSDVGLAMMKAGDVMFGKEAITEICENGISVSDLGSLIRHVFSIVSGQDVDGDDADEETYEDDSSKVRVVSDKSKK